MFSKIEVNDNYVLFTPLSGEPFYIPRYQAFSVQFNKTSVSVPVSSQATVNYIVKDVPATAAITAITESGYYAQLTRSYNDADHSLSGVITITALETAAPSSSMLVLVSDGAGHMEKYTIALTRQ